MQNTASLPTDQFEELLRRLPAALDLDSLARQTKAIERRRALDSGADLLRLALARGPGGLSLSETAAWATMLGLAEMSDPAVKYRLDKAVEFLDAVIRAHGSLFWNVTYVVPPEHLNDAGHRYEYAQFAFAPNAQVGGWWRMCVGKQYGQ